MAYPPDHTARLAAGLRRLMEQTGHVEQKGLAVAAGLNDTAVRDILKGKSLDPRVSTVAALARVLGPGVLDLFELPVPSVLSSQAPSAALSASDGGGGLWPAPGLEDAPAPALEAPFQPGREGVIEIGPSEFVVVPRFDARLSAGAGSLLSDPPEPEGCQLFERQWLRLITSAAPEHLALLRIDGDSMEDTFSDGDWVMIDREQVNPAREGIYALRVEDVVWVKRLSVHRPNRTIAVISDNKRWPPQSWPADQVAVIGRVVWLVGRKVF